jgi:hypothetical protein
VGALGAGGEAFGLIPKLDVAGSSPVARSVRSIRKTLIPNDFWTSIAETLSASLVLVTDPVTGILPCCSASRAQSNARCSGVNVASIASTSESLTAGTSEFDAAPSTSAPDA